MAKKITVIGDGGWGTALALLLHRKGHDVSLWGKFPDYIEETRRKRENVKFLPGIPLPADFRLVSGLSPVLGEADALVVVVPVQFIRPTLIELKPVLNRRALMVSAAKGLEKGTLQRPSEIIREVLGRVRCGVLSGPSHAEEVARLLPANVVVASRDRRAAKEIQDLFMSPTLRVYTAADPVGVELGGALKNVIALAAGICDGIGLGDNAKAALLTRGIVEMSRIGKMFGARESAFFGLSGIGDLITTAYSKHGRNLFVGTEIGKGRTLADVLKNMAQVAEGVWTTQALHQLADKKKADLPITQETYRVLFEGKDPRAAVKDLMERVAKSEF